MNRDICNFAYATGLMAAKNAAEDIRRLVLNKFNDLYRETT
jgi:hypothetical protein